MPNNKNNRYKCKICSKSKHPNEYITHLNMCDICVGQIMMELCLQGKSVEDFYKKYNITK